MHFDRCILLCNYILTIFWNISINPVYLTVSPSIQLLPGGNNYADPYHRSLVLPILEFHINKIIDYVLSFPYSTCFRDHHSCCCIYQKFVPFFFFFFAESCSISSIYQNLFIYLYVDGHKDFFPVWGYYK